MSTEAPARTIVRAVLIVVAVVLLLYLIYLVRTPLLWIFIAGFIAIALAGPVNHLSRHMKRGFAITIVFVVLLLIPIALTALIVPPIVTEGGDLVDKAPEYSRDVTEYVQKNDTLRGINEDYQVTQSLEEEANKLPGKIGDAAGVLRDIGFGLVSSIFALVTILVMTAFLLGSGPAWRQRFLEMQPPDRAERLGRVADRVSKAVSGYVGGMLAQATIAGVLSYIVLTILGVPFAAPLAVLIFFFDLIPLVGATIAAVVVGIVTLFTDFPTATIIWTIWSILYQQVENNVIQPQIQKRSVDVHPFVVLVSVLFGATLLGVLGALLAIPVAASIQIALKEWWAWRRDTTVGAREEALKTGEPPNPSQPLPPIPPEPATEG